MLYLFPIPKSQDFYHCRFRFDYDDFIIFTTPAFGTCIGAVRVSAYFTRIVGILQQLALGLATL